MTIKELLGVIKSRYKRLVFKEENVEKMKRVGGGKRKRMEKEERGKVIRKDKKNHRKRWEKRSTTW